MILVSIAWNRAIYGQLWSESSVTVLWAFLFWKQSERGLGVISFADNMLCLKWRGQVSTNQDFEQRVYQYFIIISPRTFCQLWNQNWSKLSQIFFLSRDDCQNWSNFRVGDCQFLEAQVVNSSSGGGFSLNKLYPKQRCFSFIPSSSMWSSSFLTNPPSVPFLCWPVFF